MKRFFVYWCLALALTSLVFTSCDNNNSAGPIESDTSDYNVYFWDQLTENWIFEYNPASGAIDSFQVPIEYIRSWGGVQASPDGSILYVSSETSTLVVDIATRTVVHTIPHTGSLAIAPDGQHIAIGRSSLYIIQTSDYSVVYSDDLGGYGAAFSASGTKLYRGYGQYSTEPFGVRIIDLADNFSITDHPLPVDFMNLVQVVPSADEAIWYLYFNGFCSSAFGVYDTAEDSIIYIETFSPGYGKVYSCSDYDQVYYTNPGPLVGQDICLDHPPSEYYQYDPETNLVTAISTLGILDSPRDTFCPIRDIYLSPDAKWLVLSSNDVLFSFDLSQPASESPIIYEHSSTIDDLTGKLTK